MSSLEDIVASINADRRADGLTPGEYRTGDDLLRDALASSPSLVEADRRPVVPSAIARTHRQHERKPSHAQSLKPVAEAVK
jgi:hypothetical protein